MKRNVAVLLVLVMALFAFAGCGGSNNEPAANNDQNNAESTVIRVGASVTPHAEILAVAKEVMAGEGYDLEIVEYNDYVIPNTATESGDIDANYFQHEPYLIDFNEKNDTHLVSVAAIHYEPFGIYAGKTAALADIAEGGVIAVPNDGTNEARALQLLQAQGLITLKEGVGLAATAIDIVENPLNLEIKEIEAAQLARALPDVDAAVINGNYAIEAGLKVSEALAIEDKDSEAAQTFANILVVKEGNEENEAIQALAAALQSEEVRTFIEETYDDAVIPMF